ncbi:hypothetical protein EJ02DRAFT_101262 [Clathrospora elynae]|uniref:Uncharacterized protein n=1 Tax=Clathrospora elynae TaxID=706981 RepID=A0A6A5S8D9_9PLEO|nr:hypothetical protein EJ02DRAFT_101262 [Clathrospora elynae]
MMPTSQNLLDRSSGKDSAPSTGTPRCLLDAAALYLSDTANTSTSAQLQSMHAASQDPFAYYRAFVDTSISQGRGTYDYGRDYDGYTRHTDAIGAEDVQDMGNQQHTRARAVPYNLAVRLANRSNGAPLATIVEQGSYSTLNSHGSLLSVGRFPSLRVVENTSPGRTSHGASRSLDEITLHRIQEDAQQEHRLDAASGAQEKPSYKDYGKSYPVNNKTPPTVSTPTQIPQVLEPQFGDTDWDTNNRTVKGFFRGVLQNVRAASRTRSRSSSTHASAVEHWGDRPETSDSSSPQSQLQASETSQPSNDRLDTPCCVPTSSLSTNSTPDPDSQARNPKNWSANSEPSARAYLPLLDAFPGKVEPKTESGTVPRLLPPSVATRTREKAPSVRLVDPEPRDEAQDGCTAGGLTLAIESRNSTSAGHAFYGVSVPPGINASSIIEHDRAREASRNASFCSTMSTSYSGTVLGIDLDLQHDFPHPVRRSRSPTPVAPVWFTPQMAELERQACVSESPEEPKQDAVAEPQCHSITSSALSSLLPIAAASGIIRPNYNTPKISFFSPSGNLIQPEGSLTPGTTSASDFSGSPTTTTSYYNTTTRSTYSAFPSTCLPPARPSLRPMTTPPTSSAPLPAHLRHHHNYRHVEKSQIDSTVDSTESFIVPAPAIKGCDGVVRSGSFTFRSILRPFHDKTEESPERKHHRSARAFASDVKYEARFHKARLITAAVTSCTTAGKGKKIRKRRAESKRAAAHAYTVTGTPVSKKSNGKDVGLLGPLTGHALRICFCQPYDGAGKQTADTLCMSRPAGTSTPKRQSHVKEVDADTVLPNARVVSGNYRNEGNVRKRKQGAGTVGRHTRVRSDSAVSIGAALRTATVGR